MEGKLKEILLRNHTLPLIRKAERTPRKITGMTSGNIAALSADTFAYKQSRAYQAQIAEIEARKAQALAEAYRLSLR